MARFGEKVFDCKEVLKSCRIPVSCAGDQWFFNVGKNSVVNVQDLKTLHTWTLTHPHYFTSSVIYSDGNLYCVMDTNVVIKWSIEEDNLKNAEKIEFQDSVFAIIPVKGEQPLIIFDSGKYAIITSTFNSIKSFDLLPLKENEEIVWADACVTSARDIEVFCFVFNQKTQNRILYNFTLDKENISAPSLLSQKICREKTNILKSWCFNHQDFLFLSLWSDGIICAHNVKESKDTDLLSIKDVETNSLIDIDCIDSTHIAVARSHSKQEECVLEIWDSKCAILKAKKVLKTSRLNYVQIAAINSNMFLCFNNELVSVPFHVEDPTFYAALGMSESNKYKQHSWNTDLELVQFSTDDETEAMDLSFNQDSLDSLESIVENLKSQNSPDLMCIPESELVKLLQLAIRHQKEENSDAQRHLYNLLNIIFSAPFNDILIVKYLKRTNLEETLIALRWLLSFLNHTMIMPSNVSERPSDLQIVNWTCIIIQSHTEALLFSKDKASRKLLKQLEKALSLKIEEYEDFDCIQSYFSILEKPDILPQNCSIGKYCIETLEI